MRSDSDTAPNPSLAHGLEGFIYQPKPRGLSPVFRFSDSAARSQDPACSLPTPSSSPAPRSKDPGSCLTIEHLARCEAEYETSDTLGRALAALPLRSPGYRLVTLNREEEDEHILSARSFGLNDISDAYQRLRSSSSDRAVVITKPPKVTKVAPRPSAQAYLTPPSSPES
ncbi:hypothetical protein FRC12_014970 [Ceratobasidium sp. 428]|nr:hypothetical protein FRC12_014970 [Ceratobasidium sp. 428]